jgi:hypothetical protein
MIWINLKLTAIYQLDIKSTNITAVVLKANRALLAVSVYVPPRLGLVGHEALMTYLGPMRQTIYSLREEHGDRLDILVVGDFNHHDQLWGGDLVATATRQGEADPIFLFIRKFRFQSVLPGYSHLVRVTGIGSDTRIWVRLSRCALLWRLLLGKW